MAHVEYYEFLGVSRDASDEALKKAYRRLALKYHPDKNGDPELFKRLTDTYDVLRSAEKRKLYDLHGPGFDKGHSHAQGGPAAARTGFSMEEVFGSVFGGFQPRPADVGKKKAKQIRHTVFLSMEEMYRGRKLKIAVTRAVLCSRCDGEGGKGVSFHPCVPCAGRGYSVSSSGSIFQSSSRCQGCDSTGKARKVGDPCAGCASSGMVTERVILEPVVAPGARVNMCFNFRGQGDRLNAKGSVPGDVVITIAQKPCPSFERKGNDLYAEKEISLKQALSGFSVGVKHLDDRVIDISVPRGKVTPPGTVFGVAGEGIPAKKGTLFVTIRVRFPETFAESSIELLDILGDLG
ncbi:unnamed protein product [Pylaiella littoralis]